MAVTSKRSRMVLLYMLTLSIVSLQPSLVEAAGNQRGSPMEMVDQHVKNNTVMVFSKSFCPFSKKVKKLLDQENIKFGVLELDLIGNFFTLK